MHFSERDIKKPLKKYLHRYFTNSSNTEPAVRASQVFDYHNIDSQEKLNSITPEEFRNMFYTYLSGVSTDGVYHPPGQDNNMRDLSRFLEDNNLWGRALRWVKENNSQNPIF